MANKRKQKLQTGEVWTEEELADYLGFKFIAGFTKGGAPFGTEISGDETDSANEILDTDENLPFKKNGDDSTWANSASFS